MIAILRIGFIPFVFQLLLCLCCRKAWQKAIPIIISTALFVASLVLAVLIEDPNFPLDYVIFFSGNTSWLEDHWVMVWILVIIPPIQGLGWLTAFLIREVKKLLNRGKRQVK